MILFGIVRYHTIPFSRVKSRFLTVGSQIDEVNYWWQSRAIEILRSSVFRSSSQRKGEKADLMVLRSLEDRWPLCLKVPWWRMGTCFIRVPTDTDPPESIDASFSFFVNSYFTESISGCLAFYLLSCVSNLSIITALLTFSESESHSCWSIFLRPRP